MASKIITRILAVVSELLIGIVILGMGVINLIAVTKPVEISVFWSVLLIIVGIGLMIFAIVDFGILKNHYSE